MRRHLDKIGMIASSICMIHCILLPFVIIMFPFLFVALAAGQVFEWAFIIFSIVLALFAMVNGYAYHKKPIPVVLALAGFCIFIFSHAVIGHDLNHGVFAGVMPYLIGGSCIFAAHFLNHKFIHNSKCACEHIKD